MKPLWISHRGLAVNAAENSMEAFRDAIRNGYTALETDLRITADGHIVLHHDAAFIDERGISWNVSSLSRSALKRNLPNVSFLDEFIEEFGAYSWTFDIKPEAADQVIDGLLRFIRFGGAAASKISQSRYVTWRRSHLGRVERLFPNARFYAQEADCWRAGLAVLLRVPQFGGIQPGRTYALPPRIGQKVLFNRQVVDVYKCRGAYVVAMLPQTLEDTLAAVDAGFDEILSNGLIVDNSSSQNR